MNTGILYARMAITVALSMYTTRVVLQALGVDDFGVFSLVGGTIGMLSFLNGSMVAATQRFMSYAQGQGNNERQYQIFNASLLLRAAATAAAATHGVAERAGERGIGSVGRGVAGGIGNGDPLAGRGNEGGGSLRILGDQFADDLSRGLALRAGRGCEASSGGRGSMVRAMRCTYTALARRCALMGPRNR